jgi:uncharacterized protein
MEEYEERAKKSIDKLKIRLKEIKCPSKYLYLYDLADQYYKDSIHYFEKKDYFTSFGCSDYAYGILDSLDFIINGNFPKP